MKILGLILILILGLIVSSCGNKTERRKENFYENKLSEIQKNTKGEVRNKWTRMKVDAPTLKGIVNISGIIKKLLKSETVTLNIYRNTGELLDKELNTIFEKCTMKGTSRDKLYEVLMPMVGFIENLKEKEEFVCADAIRDLVAQMTIFNRTFTR